MTNMAGQTIRELSSEIATLRRLRPNLKKAVSHLVLSHDPTQRKLTVQEWKEAVQIALKEHGAEEAAHAAWRHADTDTDHVHIFFCRILPSGEVVSDSHNYRKNEAAARLIERTFMLDAPTPTSAEDRPGDRQARDSASRRADRRGTPLPSKIDARAIRSALTEARDRDHFLQLLAELGIEAEFDRRRGEIYGWRLRRVGAAEWLKASTIAKDISWPKIAHRFAESESATPVQAKTETDKYARAPAPLRQMLREQHQQRQMVPTPKPDSRTQTTTKSFDIDLAEVDRATRDFGPLSRAMAALGFACLKYALSFLKHVIGWIKRLLEKIFGIGIRETQMASGPQVMTYEPYTIDTEAREVPNAEAEAAKLVDQVTAALESKDAAMLPDVEGRDTIAATMMADQGREPEAGAHDLDAMFAPEVTDAAATAPVASPDTPAVPSKGALVMFLDASKAFALAAELVRVAQLKDIMYVDTRPQAQIRHDAATAEVSEVENASNLWRRDHKVAAALGADPLGFKPRAEAARGRAVKTQAALHKADREHAEFEILFAKTPAPAVPFALQGRHAASAEALKNAQELLFSRARLNLTVLDGNPMLRQKREQFGNQIRRAETRLAAFLVEPRMQKTVIKDVEDMIRSLASEVAIERARISLRHEVGDGQNADEAGQHGFAAVPGQ